MNFDFKLPSSLVAFYPILKRSNCRLLSLNGSNGELVNGVFTDLLHQLNKGDLLVLNNTKVIPARIYGRKSSGGKIEVLVERLLDDRRALVHLRSSKKTFSPGMWFLLGDVEKIKVNIINRRGFLFEVYFEDDRRVVDILENIGHVPLPPYIKRFDEAIDKEFYQTVYCSIPGAVASPTAGLHFDNALLSSLKKKGIEIVYVTLHIGMGTFQRVHVTNIKDHVIHSEYVEVNQDVVDAIFKCKLRGNKVVAVGTTVVRSLETAAKFSKINLISPFFNYTRIFIYPGYKYRIIDALITNFHLPKSTLIMLVSAFAGHKNTMLAYRLAIDLQYRFFSYGDAMFITKNPNASKEKLF